LECHGTGFPVVSRFTFLYAFYFLLLTLNFELQTIKPSTAAATATIPYLCAFIAFLAVLFFGGHSVVIQLSFGGHSVVSRSGFRVSCLALLRYLTVWLLQLRLQLQLFHTFAPSFAFLAVYFSVVISGFGFRLIDSLITATHLFIR
jgi:hypothetical protein